MVYDISNKHIVRKKLNKFLKMLSGLLMPDKTIKKNRLILGQAGKSQVETTMGKTILIMGSDGSGRIAATLELTRQAIAQGSGVLFIDTMAGNANANKIGMFASLSGRENNFYVKGAFDASEVKIADAVSFGDILYWGPSAAADSPQAYAAEVSADLDDLSTALMKRVAQPHRSHIVIVMIDVIEAFGEFPQQLKTLSSILRSVNATLICCEFGDSDISADLEKNLDCFIQMKTDQVIRRPSKPNLRNMRRREDLKSGQALVRLKEARHEIGPVELSYLSADYIPVPTAKPVNMIGQAEEVAA